jgi:hypothetical protein
VQTTHKKEVILMDTILFPLGAVVMTPGARDFMQEQGLDASHLLTRHVTGDWGDLDEHDKEANDQALDDGSRIFSAYCIGEQELWIITEADRSVTTILRPDEY